MTAEVSKKLCPAKTAGPDTRARMVQQLLTDTADDPLEMLKYFRHLVTCPASPSLEMGIDEVAEKKCLPKIAGFLYDDSLEMQKEAAWALGNVAFAAEHHIAGMVLDGVVAPLVGLLRSTDKPAQNIASQSLANITALICGREEALASGVVTPLLTLLQSDEIPRGASMLLRNLCMGNDPPPSLSYLTPCLATLSRFAFHSDDDISDDNCFALTSLSKIYGPSLSNTLGPAFLSQLLKLQRMNPERRAFKKLLSELTKTTPNSSCHSQVDVTDGSTKVAEQKSPQNNLTPAPNSVVKRRSRSPSPPSAASAVPNKYNAKRMKTDPSTTACISPARPKTRALSQRLVSTTPNHAACYTHQKKAELFRAAEKGDLERVEHFVHHSGPAVTFGPRACNLLHYAAAHNQSHVVLFLLDFISPNTVTTHYHTAAHLAAMQGHAQVLRILLGDPLMDPDKRDASGNTYTHYLRRFLFEAIEKEDARRVLSLLSVGADANNIQRAVKGPVARALQNASTNNVTRVQRRESIVRGLDTKRGTAGTLKDVSESLPQSTAPQQLSQLPVGTMELPTLWYTSEFSGSDVYKVDAARGGYVFLLSYGSFKGRPDLQLENSETDTHNLATLFRQMGYSGHAHFSLTAKQTRQQLAALRDNKMLKQADCAIFVISSHGASRRHFLASDMQTIETQWVLDFFKDSQCPSLKNKPKIFIWNLCRGHFQEKTGRGSSQGEVRCLMVEPLRDVLCLDGNSRGLTCNSSSDEGTPFIGALCRSLARHAAGKELTQWYRDFLQEYVTVAPDAVPQLTNYGFNKKFYFNPTQKFARKM